MPIPFILYHSPRYGKSRSAFNLPQERGIEAEVTHYLDTPPGLATLQDIFRKLGLESARGMMRVKDSLYQELELNNPDLGDDVLLQAVAEHLALLERPIPVTPDKTTIGRSLEDIGALLPEQGEAV